MAWYFFVIRPLAYVVGVVLWLVFVVPVKLAVRAIQRARRRRMARRVAYPLGR